MYIYNFSKKVYGKLKKVKGKIDVGREREFI